MKKYMIFLLVALLVGCGGNSTPINYCRVTAEIAETSTPADTVVIECTNMSDSVSTLAVWVDVFIDYDDGSDEVEDHTFTTILPGETSSFSFIKLGETITDVNTSFTVAWQG